MRLDVKLELLHGLVRERRRRADAHSLRGPPRVIGRWGGV